MTTAMASFSWIYNISLIDLRTTWMTRFVVESTTELFGSGVWFIFFQYLSIIASLFRNGTGISTRMKSISISILWMTLAYSSDVPRVFTQSRDDITVVLLVIIDAEDIDDEFSKEVDDSVLRVINGNEWGRWWVIYL